MFCLLCFSVYKPSYYNKGDRNKAERLKNRKDQLHPFKWVSPSAVTCPMDCLNLPFNYYWPRLVLQHIRCVCVCVAKCMIVACCEHMAHLYLFDCGASRWPVQHGCVLLVCCGFCGTETQMSSWKKLVLFTQCLLPWLSLNHRAAVWSGTYFIRVCVCLELIASHGNTVWLNRQGNHSVPYT